MKITDRTFAENIEIDCLCAGDVFRYDGNVYMVTEDKTDKEVTGIDLTNGTFKDLRLDTVVCPLDAEVTVNSPRKNEVET